MSRRKRREKSICSAKFKTNTLGCAEKLQLRMHEDLPPTYPRHMKNEMIESFLKENGECGQRALDGLDECMNPHADLTLAQRKEAEWLDKLGIMHKYYSRRKTRDLIRNMEMTHGGARNVAARRAWNHLRTRK